MFNFFEELFAPGRKHTAEEQKRLELSRVDLGIGDPARGPIDLTSGKVTLLRPPPEAGRPDGGTRQGGDGRADRTPPGDSRDLPDRDRPDRDLPDRDRPDRDLPDRDRPDRDRPDQDRTGA
ncbi:DUF6191 domain-containing protein [Streptomyces atroolivaceus]|uniref:DUF6191 domain-containing protein n=1 Tax=Streptomyces atroolivaceus TaxID=66869 RepID=UPI0033F21277